MPREQIRRDPRGPRLTKWREDMGLSQTGLADIIPFSRRSLTDFERGYRMQEPHEISEEAWQKLLACCVCVQQGLYMTDDFKVVTTLRPMGKVSRPVRRR